MKAAEIFCVSCPCAVVHCRVFALWQIDILVYKVSNISRNSLRVIKAQAALWTDYDQRRLTVYMKQRYDKAAATVQRGNRIERLPTAANEETFAFVGQSV